MKKIRLTLLMTIIAISCTKQEAGDSVTTFPEDALGSVSFECLIENSTTTDTKSTEDNIWNNLEEEDGKIALPDDILPSVDDFSVSIEGQYIIPDEETGVQEPDGTVADYSLTGLTLKEYNDDVPYMYGGDYAIILEYGSSTDEGYNKPYYYKEYDFEVIARKYDVKSISLELSNSVIREIQTTDMFNNYYTDCSFKITTTSGTEIELETGVKTLFFVEAGTTLTLSGTATKENGYDVSFSGVIGTTVANTCYTITIDATDVGQGGISVEFNDDISNFNEIGYLADMNPN